MENCDYTFIVSSEITSSTVIPIRYLGLPCLGDALIILLITSLIFLWRCSFPSASTSFFFCFIHLISHTRASSSAVLNSTPFPPYSAPPDNNLRWQPNDSLMFCTFPISAWISLIFLAGPLNRISKWALQGKTSSSVSSPVRAVVIRSWPSDLSAPPLLRSTSSWSELSSQVFPGPGPSSSVSSLLLTGLQWALNHCKITIILVSFCQPLTLARCHTPWAATTVYLF